MDENLFLKELEKRVRVEGGRKTLSCHEAHELAGGSTESLALIGRWCEKEKVKIIRCELGCF